MEMEMEMVFHYYYSRVGSWKPLGSASGAYTKDRKMEVESWEERRRDIKDIIIFEGAESSKSKSSSA